MASITVRPATFSDTKFIVDMDAELLSFEPVADDSVPTKYIDEHVEQLCTSKICPPWALREKDVNLFANVRPSLVNGQYETKILVAETKLSNRNSTADWVCGCLIYEEWPDSLGIVHLGVHPHCSVEETLDQLLNFVKSKAGKTKTRRKLTHFVRDHDAAGIRIFLPAYKKHGFSIKLVPNYFHDTSYDWEYWPQKMDAWKCELELPDKKDEIWDDETPSFVSV